MRKLLNHGRKSLNLESNPLNHGVKPFNLEVKDIRLG